MTFLEIVIIILAVSYVTFIFGSMIYKHYKGEPTGECACCALKNKRLARKIEKIRKKNRKKQLKANSI